MPPTDPRKLAFATSGAALVAAVVLVVAVLPAEYGVDPTGLGAALGFSKLSSGPDEPPVVIAPDAAPPPLFELQATWRLMTVPLGEPKGYLTTARSEELVTLPLAVPNLTSVTARLTWDDQDRLGGQVTRGDTFEISIRGPGGVRSQLAQATNEPGTPGNVSTTLNLASVPFPQENETSGLHFATKEDRSGIGDWTFVVRLYRAGGVDGLDEEDPGNAWTLTVTGEAYALDVKKRADREGDRVRISLEPGRGVEYKFAMREGATLVYAWTSTGPVYWDLHAEEEGASPDDFTRYAEGRSRAEEGTITAPFHGRHGWYWRNDGATPVAITLETSGEYRILGVPR